MNNIDNTIQGYLSIVDKNEYLSAGISLVLVLYAGLAAPKLPEYIARLFDNILVKLVVFFLIVYSAKKDPRIAIIASIAVMVTLHTLSRFDFNNQIMNMIPFGNSQENMDPSESLKTIKTNDLENNNIVNEPELIDLQNESVSPSIEDQGEGSCSYKANFRNNFYPQYVDGDVDAHKVRYTENDISGYDKNASFASV